MSRVALAGALAAGMVLAGCIDAHEEANGRRRLKVIVLPYLSFAPLFIASDEGYFAEQGLDLEFIRMQLSAEAVPALDRGELDVTGGTMSLAVLNAIARGARIRVVADKGYVSRDGCAYTALLARTALARQALRPDAGGFRGRRIAAERASYSGYCVEKSLHSVGLSVDDVDLVSVPDEILADALDRGGVDVAHTSEPWVTRLVQGGHATLWIPLRQVLPDSQYAFLLYGPNLLDRDPEAGRRFMVAYLRGVRRYLEGKTRRNVAIVSKHTGLDAGLLQQACWPQFRDTGSIEVQSVLDFQAWGRSKDLLDATLPVGGFWDARFVEHANRVLRGEPQ